MDLLGGKLGVPSSLLSSLVFFRDVVETRGGVPLKRYLLAVVDVLASLTVCRLGNRNFQENSRENTTQEKGDNQLITMFQKRYQLEYITLDITVKPFSRVHLKTGTVPFLRGHHQYIQQAFTTAAIP